MTRRSIWRMSITTLAAAALVSACASTPEQEAETPIGPGGSGGTGTFVEPGTGGTGGGAGGTGGSSRGITGGAVVGVQDSETEKLQMGLDAIYFDYDRSTLRPEAASQLKQHAEKIRAFPDWAYVTIEGHCDERGTEEYNLALGDRRADAVRRYLATLGSPDS